MKLKSPRGGVQQAGVYKSNCEKRYSFFSRFYLRLIVITSG